MRGRKGTDVLVLTRDGLPELYRAASLTSRRGQRRVVQLNLVLILAGLASGIFALFGGQDGPAWHAWADAMAALWFAVAAVGGAMLNAGKAHRRWFDGRAVKYSRRVNFRGQFLLLTLRSADR